MRFAETDAQGIAHNAVYLVWFEVARIDYLARFRGGYPRAASRRDRGARRSSRTCATSRQRASTTGCTIRARCGDLRGARFRFDYALERDGEAIADGWTHHACVDATHAPADPRPGLARGGDRYCGELTPAGPVGPLGPLGPDGPFGGGRRLRPRLRPDAHDARLAPVGRVPRVVVEQRATRRVDATADARRARRLAALLDHGRADEHRRVGHALQRRRTGVDERPGLADSTRRCSGAP